MGDPAIVGEVYSALCGVLAALALCTATRLVYVAAARSRPGLAIGSGIAVALVVRMVVAIAIDGMPTLQVLRGPDEDGFLAQAYDAGTNGDLGHVASQLVGNLHLGVMTLQLKVLGPVASLPLRFTNLTFAMVGIIALAAAAHDLGGPRAGVLAAWLLALEPASVFFTGVLHKEAAILAAEGIVVLGAVSVWRSLSWGGAAVMGFGCGVGFLARPYVGGFLAAAAVLIGLAATIRADQSGRRRWLVVAVVAVVGFAGAIFVAAEARPLLDRLQAFQNASVDDGSNLALPPVDFSTPGAAALSTVRRTGDFVARPFPWQLANNSQRLGAVVTLLNYAVLALCVAAAWHTPRRLRLAVVPILLLTGAIVMAYALTTANAGTGFRHRMHATALMLVVGSVLAAPHLERRRIGRPIVGRVRAIPPRVG